jgi:hypothetical protein
MKLRFKQRMWALMISASCTALYFVDPARRPCNRNDATGCAQNQACKRNLYPKRTFSPADLNPVRQIVQHYMPDI